MKLNILMLCTSLILSFNSWADIYIVTQKNAPIEHISQQDLTAIYLKKKVYWDNSELILPINLSAQSPLREQLSQIIFKRSTRAMGSYWDKMSFKGVSPPLIQASQQAALLFIQRIPNSIGYTSIKPDNSLLKVLLKLETPE